MTHTLVSFLGKAYIDPNNGYRTARYRFDDGDEIETPFFGLALKEHLKPDRLALFGTEGSMWDVLIEHLAAEGDEEGLRLELIDAANQGRVNDALLKRITPLVERSLGLPCALTLIDYGRNAQGQSDILRGIANVVPSGRVSLDLTHGFRHLAALGLLSAFFLERVAELQIQSLYYGALDMTADNVTPVIRLDGLMAVQHWNDALQRFDQNGDYAVFAPLLEKDGVPANKARCLERAAYYERTLNLSDARAQIRTFLKMLDEPDAPLSGPSALFRDALAKRLAWARNGNLFDHQARLAHFYLGNRDYLRAALFAYEAVITRGCGERGLNPLDWNKGRNPAVHDLDQEFKNGSHPKERRDAYWMLKNLRNSLAHGNPAREEHYRRIIADPGRLPNELEKAMDVMLNNQSQ